MDAVTDADLDRALAAGEAYVRSHVLAVSARYDAVSDRVVVALSNGETVSFAPRVADGLEDASVEALSAVEVLGIGTGLHWESLDVDLSVEGLLNGRFGELSSRTGGGENDALARAAS